MTDDPFDWDDHDEWPDEEKEAYRRGWKDGKTKLVSHVMNTIAKSIKDH